MTIEWYGNMRKLKKKYGNIYFGGLNSSFLVNDLKANLNWIITGTIIGRIGQCSKRKIILLQITELNS